MKIENTKLEALHDYLVKGGSAEQEDVAKQIGVPADDEATVNAYVEALKARWPDVYGEPEKPEKPAAKKTATKKTAKVAEPADTPKIYRLRRPDGTVTALEVVAAKNGTVVLEEPTPKDLVTLIVKGKQVTVDLIQIARHPSDSPHGVPNAKLLEMAELARA